MFNLFAFYNLIKDVKYVFVKFKYLSLYNLVM